MKKGDRLDFEKLNIACEENFRFCVGDWFTDVDSNLNPSKNWTLSFTLEKDGSVTVCTSAWDNEVEVKAEEFYNTTFYYSGTISNKFVMSPCQCPPTKERKYCERCGINTPWQYKK